MRVAEHAPGAPAWRSSWRARGRAGLLLAVVAGDAAAAQEACDRPDPPGIPDDHAASREAMRDANGELAGYTDAMEEYLDCLQGEDEDAADDLARVTREWDDAATDSGYR